MVYIDKIKIQVLITDPPEKFCAKCCKTMQVVDRMMEAFPEFSERIEILNKSINSNDVIKNYGKLNAPAIILNNTVYSEGHVPVIKKLSRDIIRLLNF